MAEYRTSWSIPADVDGTFATNSHKFPAVVELVATGEKGAPDVFVRCELRDGVPEVVEFRLTAKSNGRAVRSADLNGWQPLEGLALNGFRNAAQKLDVTNPFGPRGPQDEREFWAIGRDLDYAQHTRTGPSDHELEGVAQIYRDAVDGRPTEAVQIQMGYSRRTAARRVAQARERGFLPPTTPGKKNA